MSALDGTGADALGVDGPEPAAAHVSAATAEPRPAGRPRPALRLVKG